MHCINCIPFVYECKKKKGKISLAQSIFKKLMLASRNCLVPSQVLVVPLLDYLFWLLVSSNSFPNPLFKKYWNNVSSSPIFDAPGILKITVSDAQITFTSSSPSMVPIWFLTSVALFQIYSHLKCPYSWFHRKFTTWQVGPELPPLFLQIGQELQSEQASTDVHSSCSLSKKE